MDEIGVCLRRDLLLDLGGLSFGNVENLLKEGAGYGACLSMGALLGGHRGRAPSLGTLDDRWKGLWRRASVSIGVPLGNMEECLSNGDFKRWM
jgi:hypothetical protein